MTGIREPDMLTGMTERDWLIALEVFDVIAAFRRAAKRCHPDLGGTEAQFIELVKARDRLLAALGTRAAAPKMPEFAPKGARLRYGRWRPAGGAGQIGHTRQLTG